MWVTKKWTRSLVFKLQKYWNLDPRTNATDKTLTKLIVIFDTSESNSKVWMWEGDLIETNMRKAPKLLKSKRVSGCNGTRQAIISRRNKGLHISELRIWMENRVYINEVPDRISEKIQWQDPTEYNIHRNEGCQWSECSVMSKNRIVTHTWIGGV